MLIELRDKSPWYEKFYYPAGEMQVRLYQNKLEEIASEDRIMITARLHSADAIVELAMLKDALNEVMNRESKLEIFIPYWPYARADRRFVPGDSFGLKVFTQMMTTLGSTIYTLDVHSKRSIELTDNNWVFSKFLHNISPLSYIAQAVEDFNIEGYITVLFPDAGSLERYELPTRMGKVRLHFLHAEKVRDPATGKLSGFKVPSVMEFPTDPVLIVDDICDGGGTFLGIADAMKEYGLSLGLYVTHGIFSKGLDELSKRFDNIYTTNSLLHLPSTYTYAALQNKGFQFTEFDCFKDIESRSFVAKYLDSVLTARKG